MNFNFINNRYKRRCIGALASLFLLIFVYTHFHSHLPQENNGIWVEAEKAKRGSIALDIHAVGTLVAARQITITSEAAGHIANVYFKDGAFVKKGMPLIQIDDAIPKAQLNAAKADFDFSQITYQRRATLGKKGLWPKQEIDQARADLEEKKALLQEKQVIVDKMLLLAPFDGVLGKSQVSLGHYVTSGQALVALTDIEFLRAEFTVSEKYLPALKLGQTVKITISAYPDKIFEGRIAYISPTIDAAGRTISLYAEVANADHLLTSGMSVAITQSLGIQANTILVPNKSIMATVDGQQVYKIVDHKVYAVPVVLGQRTEETVEILQGITENEVIVTAGQQKLHDNVDVQIKV